MRIIAGEFRGRRLLDPSDRATRPITDRVKQSIFDVLGDRVAEVQVFDVFAGTGSFGLEALSRGATGCVFFERHRPALGRLRRNIETLGVVERCRIVATDLFHLSDGELNALPTAGMIFFDPPYACVGDRPAELHELLQRFARALTPEGLIVFRHEKGDEFEAGLPLLDERTWGAMRVRFLGAEIAAPDNRSAENAVHDDAREAPRFRGERWRPVVRTPPK